MQFEVKEIKKTTYQGSTKETTFTTSLKSAEGATATIHEESECSFKVNDKVTVGKSE